MDKINAIETSDISNGWAGNVDVELINWAAIDPLIDPFRSPIHSQVININSLTSGIFICCDIHLDVYFISRAPFHRR